MKGAASMLSRADALMAITGMEMRLSHPGMLEDGLVSTKFALEGEVVEDSLRAMVSLYNS
jgi:hypothetical protein